MDIRPIHSHPAQTSAAFADKTAQVADAPVAAKPAAPAVAAGAAAVQQAGTVPNLSELSSAVKNINKILQDRSQNLEFTVDSENDRTIVKVVDQKTKEILRQIPSEEALEISKAIDQAMHGLLIRQKA
ncbi:flagellar protein FlaG [Noviherbaspirillum sp.]|jgi:flagellar protein FlaG|uniref:flagellar protein FlaG n=1 Tax=Noviherbaspirillum sp. TaxID=1926288 RepID=UPI0025EBBEB9|nr:flagellar protein FlaG [Noviherbaspirillum sp.]